jgi:hypothetical protein
VTVANNEKENIIMGDTDFVGSHEKADNGFGQNGFQGPSSSVNGKQPALGNPKVSPPSVIAATGDWQTRQLEGGNVNPTNVPTAFGQRNRNDNAGQIAATLSRGRKR